MTKIITMKKSKYDRMEADKLRKQWVKNPPDGYSVGEIKQMPDDAILDMAYFLSEFDFDEETTQKDPEVIIQLIDDTSEPDEGPF